MVRPFTAEERESIRRKLGEAARVCLAKHGVKGTTVDELVRRAGISKGSFYNFYSTKEGLFFAVLEEYQETVIANLVKKLEKESSVGVNRFTDLLYQVYEAVGQSFIMKIIKMDELDYLMRKIPQDRIAHHHSLDYLLTEQIFARIRIKAGINIDIVNTALRAIFTSMIHIEAIGAQDYAAALRLLLTGLALQIVEEG